MNRMNYVGKIDGQKVSVITRAKKQKKSMENVMNTQKNQWWIRTEDRLRKRKGMENDGDSK